MCSGGAVPEKPIGELKNGLQMDRLSFHRFRANTLKLLEHTLAYALVVLHREATAAMPDVAKAEVSTLRLRLWKVGAVVKTSVRRIWFHFSETWPYRDLWVRVRQALTDFVAVLRQPRTALPTVPLTLALMTVPKFRQAAAAADGEGCAAQRRKNSHFWQRGRPSASSFRPQRPFTTSATPKLTSDEGPRLSVNRRLTPLPQVHHDNDIRTPVPTPGHGFARPGASPAEGQTVRVPVTRDTWFSGVGHEADCNLGAAPRLKLKSYQEMSLIDIDPGAAQGPGRSGRHAAPAPGRRPAASPGHGGQLRRGLGRGHLRPATPRRRAARRTTTGGIPTCPGPCPGSDLCSVILGQGGTTLAHGRRLPARRAGLAAGGRRSVGRGRARGRRQLRLPALRRHRVGVDARTARSSRSSYAQPFCPQPRVPGTANAPYLTVVPRCRGQDAAGRARPICRSRRADLPAGEAWLSWLTPEDEGPAGTVGFFVDRRRQGGAALPDSAGRQARRAGADAPARPGPEAGSRGRRCGPGRGRGRQRRAARPRHGARVRPSRRPPCRGRRPDRSRGRGAAAAAWAARRSPSSTSWTRCSRSRAR